MTMNDSRALRVPTPPQGVEIASFATYLEAQKAVDVLADGAFTVQAVTIVGSDLQMVERVTGRLTYSRVALAGAASGLWFGLFVGLMFSLFGGSNLLGTILTCVLIGGAFGMLLGVVSYAFTGGRRDFASSSQVVAGRYAVLCLPDLAGDARNRLRQAGISTSDGARPAVVAPVGPTGPVGATAYPPAAQRPTQVSQPEFGSMGAPSAPTGPAAPSAPVVPPAAATEPPRYGQRIEDAAPTESLPQQAPGQTPEQTSDQPEPRPER
ncbi:hypothetical protein FH969_05015 [Miniimonas arenae]|uniref:General stress protein 17M-like domain-containing protein n=1 Tax=Miniimonas arenae TaxID=676201 RepID=A0A5C5BE08_9MICO|nr:MULTISPECIES: general stress protein [Miniimonas]TNU76020.1 hypothetical protein FH969_05015 [Miniimonas arenae]